MNQLIDRCSPSLGVPVALHGNDRSDQRVKMIETTFCSWHTWHRIRAGEASPDFERHVMFQSLTRCIHHAPLVCSVHIWMYTHAMRKHVCTCTSYKHVHFNVAWIIHQLGLLIPNVHLTDHCFRNHRCCWTCTESVPPTNQDEFLHVHWNNKEITAIHSSEFFNSWLASMFYFGRYGISKYPTSMTSTTSQC